MVLQGMDCVLSGEEQQLKHNEHYLASMLSCSTFETELEQAERELDASLRETRGPSVGSQGLLPGLELLSRCSSSGYAAAARAHPIALLPAPG